MLSGVSITCFTASYVVALGLEVTRLLFRSGVRGAVLLGFACAGLFAHTAYLLNRALSGGASPLASQQDWYLVTAWLLAATYLYLTCYHTKTALGLFLLPLVLALVAAAAFAADPMPFVPQSASRAWGIVHGVSLLLATATVLVGFVFGTMYFVQAYLLKHKIPPPRGLRLPSLEWLQQNNSRSIGVSTILMGVGVLSGVVLNVSQPAGQVPWRDPLSLATLFMFAWLVVCACAGAFYKPVCGGRKVAYLTVASFAFLMIALGAGLFASSRHGNPKPTSDRAQEASNQISSNAPGHISTIVAREGLA
jgi:ABC-type uncharacterized transport system permease subunit